NLNIYPYCFIEEVEFFCIQSDSININIFIEIA
ncbi:AraC family transcriptional regulator, partial [Escherichia coli]|nr:AraC family transcriptional regulator [Escherichia coli]